MNTKMSSILSMTDSDRTNKADIDSDLSAIAKEFCVPADTSSNNAAETELRPTAAEFLPPGSTSNAKQSPAAEDLNAAAKVYQPPEKLKATAAEWKPTPKEMGDSSTAAFFPHTGRLNPPHAKPAVTPSMLAEVYEPPYKYSPAACAESVTLLDPQKQPDLNKKERKRLRNKLLLGQEQERSINCPRKGGQFEKMHYWMSNAAKIGKSKPTVVFIHGFGCDHTDWRHQVQALAVEAFTTIPVVAVDLVGHGKSRTDRPQRIEWLGDDVAYLIKSLDLSNVYLVGHSMGCRVASQAWHKAWQMERDIRGILFVDGSYRSDQERATNAKALEIQAKILEEQIREAVGGEKYKSVIRKMFEEMFFDNSAISEDEQQRLIQQAIDLGEDMGATLFGTTVAFDFKAVPEILKEMNRTSTDVLAIQSTTVGTDGKRKEIGVATDPWLEILYDSVDKAKFMRLLDCGGHFAQLEQPEIITSAICDLIQRSYGDKYYGKEDISTRRYILSQRSYINSLPVGK